MKWVRAHCHVVDHPKFIDAGPLGRDLWNWGMLYAGKHETDGELPLTAVSASSWGAGGKKNVVVAKKLCEVGLWEQTETGYRILKWAEMGNPTKAQIEEKRKEEREGRKGRRKRASSPPDAPADNSECPGRTPAGVPYSYSDQLTGRKDLPVLEEPASAPADPKKPPDWFAAAVETVQDGTGEKVRIADAWLRYSGHRAGKNIAPNQRDATYWLTTVMVPEARKERQEATRQAERDAKFDRERTAKADEAAKPAPYHRVAKAKPRPDEEPPVSIAEAAEHAKRLAGMFR